LKRIVDRQYIIALARMIKITVLNPDKGSKRFVKLSDMLIERFPEYPVGEPL